MVGWGLANGDRWPMQLPLEKQVCPSKKWQQQWPPTTGEIWKRIREGLLKRKGTGVSSVLQAGLGGGLQLLNALKIAPLHFSYTRTHGRWQWPVLVSLWPFYRRAKGRMSTEVSFLFLFDSHLAWKCDVSFFICLFIWIYWGWHWLIHNSKWEGMCVLAKQKNICTWGEGRISPLHPAGPQCSTLGIGRKEILILWGERVAMESRPGFLQVSWS